MYNINLSQIRERTKQLAEKFQTGQKKNIINAPAASKKPVTVSGRVTPELVKERKIAPRRTKTFNSVSHLPNTKYKVFWKNIDVTKYVKPVGPSVGISLSDRTPGKTPDTGSNKLGDDFIRTTPSGKMNFKIYQNAWLKTPTSTKQKKLQKRDLKETEDEINIVPATLPVPTTEVTLSDGKVVKVVNEPELTTPSGSASRKAASAFSKFVGTYRTSAIKYPTRRYTSYSTPKKSTSSVRNIRSSSSYSIKKSPSASPQTDYIAPYKPPAPIVYSRLASNVVQSFYVNPNEFGGAKTIDILGVDLYVRWLPKNIEESINQAEPSITINVIEVPGGIPDMEKQFWGSTVTLSGDQLQLSQDASLPSEFKFERPITLETGKFYGIAISFSDSDFALWYCKTGDRILGTNKPSPGSAKEHQGELFDTIPEELDKKARDILEKQKARDNIDLKFFVHVAEYDSTSIEVDFVNEDYEFFSIGEVFGEFLGGEEVYNLSEEEQVGTVYFNRGTRNVWGVNTVFTQSLVPGQQVVVRKAAEADPDPDTQEIVIVKRVMSDTRFITEDPMPFTQANDQTATYSVCSIGEVYVFDPLEHKLFLKNSNATSTTYFETGDMIVGIDSGAYTTIQRVEDLNISVLDTDFSMDIPTQMKVTTDFSVCNWNGTIFEVKDIGASATPLSLYSPNFLDKYYVPGQTNTSLNVIISRSNEVRISDQTNNPGYFSGSLLYDESDDSGNQGKSMVYRVKVDHVGEGSNKYETPKFDFNYMNVSTSYWQISNDCLDEHTNDGNAITKNISNKLVFGKGKNAEDIRVIMNAYKANGTDIKVYAKILNEADPDAFDDKFWTELELKDGIGEFSDTRNKNDFREYTFGFPSSPPVGDLLSATVDELVADDTNANTQFNYTASSTSYDLSTDLSDGDIIRITDALFEDNYGIFQIESITDNGNGTGTIVVTETFGGPENYAQFEDLIADSGGMTIRKIGDPNAMDGTQYTAFNNTQNFNIVRYYTPTGFYDTYNTVAIKVILLSENDNLVPFVDDYRVIGVSA